MFSSPSRLRLALTGEFLICLWGWGPTSVFWPLVSYALFIEVRQWAVTWFLLTLVTPHAMWCLSPARSPLLRRCWKIVWSGSAGVNEQFRDSRFLSLWPQMSSGNAWLLCLCIFSLICRVTCHIPFELAGTMSGQMSQRLYLGLKQNLMFLRNYGFLVLLGSWRGPLTVGQQIFPSTRRVPGSLLRSDDAAVNTHRPHFCSFGAYTWWMAEPIFLLALHSKGNKEESQCTGVAEKIFFNQIQFC